MFRPVSILLALASMIVNLLTGCCPTPETTAEQPPENYIYLYARLHETQFKGTAEQQYLPNIKEAFQDYQATFEIEEIRGAEHTVEYIGIDSKIAAPESETESLELLFLDTLRLSGAPYATQIFVVTP